MNTPETFWMRVKKDDSGCWLWTGFIENNGYGRLTYCGKHEWSHRIAFKISKGEIPRDKVVRHSCDIPKCCNPEHLILGTKLDNSIDAVIRNRRPELKKTHCKNGHPFDEKNTYYRKDRITHLGRGARECKSCKHPGHPYA